MSPEPPGVVETRPAGAADDGAQDHVPMRYQTRQQRLARELPGAEHGHAQGTRARPPGARNRHAPGRTGGRLGGVLQEQRHPPPRPLERLVGDRGVLDAELAADQLGEPQTTVGGQPEKLLHVAALGPADVGERVVEPVLLVARVVAARPRGPRDDQVQLLVVERRPRQLEADVADDHDAPLLTRHLERLIHRFAARRRGGEENRIGADAARGGQNGRDRIPIPRHQGDTGAKPLGEDRALLQRIDPDDADAGGSENLDRQETDQPEAHHHGRLTQLEVGAPDSLEGDGAEGDEGGILRVKPVGDRHGEVPRDEDIFGMGSVTGSSARHPVADGEVGHARADFDDHAGQRVPQLNRPIHLVRDELDRLGQTRAPHLVPHLAHDLGLPTEPIHHALPGDVGAFGARAEQGPRGADQDTARRAERERDVLHDHPPPLREHLSHARPRAHRSRPSASTAPPVATGASTKVMTIGTTPRF